MANGPATALKRLLRSFSQNISLELFSFQADTETVARYENWPTNAPKAT